MHKASSTSASPVAMRRLALAIGAASVPAIAPLAWAQQAPELRTQTQRYDIPAGPLSNALSRFAGEAGVLLSVPAERVDGKRSSGLSGAFGVADGFARLLQGSGLQAVQDAGGTWSLVDTGAAGAALQLGPMYVQGRLGNALGAMEGYNATHSSVATKTSLPLLETSQSVSVVTREQMNDQGSRTVAQSMRYTPGVLTTPYGGTHRYDYLSMRGFTDGSVNNLYLDGLKMMGDEATYSTLQIDPYFLERIDILKGPSSVLYGRSLPGGLAAMTSKKPQFETTRQVQATVGSNALKEGAFDFTGPLDDAGRIAYRLTGVVKDGDAEVDHVEEQRYALAPSATFNFSEDTSLTVQAYLQKDPEGGYHGGLPAEGTLYRRNGRYIDRDFFEGEADFETFERTQKLVGYQFEHRFNDVWSARQNVRYTRSDVDVEQVYAAGWSSDTELARAFTGAEEHQQAWNFDNMLQAEFATGPALHTLVGGLDYQRRKVRADYWSGSVDPIDAFEPVYGSPVVLAPGESESTRRLEQTGVYLQDLIELDRWRLSLGVRQDWVKTEVEQEASGSTSDNDPTQFTGRAGVLYLFDNGVAPYLSYSESFNPNTAADEQGNPLEPTEGKQWELGVKYQPVDSDDLYTASLFHIEQENLATKQPDEDFYRPVGAIRSQGLELEARVQLSDALRLIGSYTWTDIEYAKQTFLGTTTDVNGNSPTQAPEHMASLWADYSLMGGPLDGLKLGAGARYVGKSWMDTDNTRELPSYTLFDASASYDLGRVGLKGVNLRVNANNLTDKEYVAACASAFYCYLGEERNLTATVSYDF